MRLIDTDVSTKLDRGAFHALIRDGTEKEHVGFFQDTSLLTEWGVSHSFQPITQLSVSVICIAILFNMMLPRIIFLLLLSGVHQLATSSQVNEYRLCFPSVKRSLEVGELSTFQEVTNQYLVMKHLKVPKTIAVKQEWMPHDVVLANAAESSTWFVIEDDMAISTPCLPDICWTVTLQTTVGDNESLPLIFMNEDRDPIYIVLLRIYIPSDFFVPPFEKTKTSIITTTEEEGGTLITMTTHETIFWKRSWTWLWILAGSLTIGSLAIVAIWFVYFRSSPLRYLRKNESQDGTTDPREWLDQGEPEEELNEESSCSSFHTS